MKQIRAAALRWTVWPLIIIICLYGLSRLTGLPLPPVLTGYPKMGIPYIGSHYWILIIPLFGFMSGFYLDVVPEFLIGPNGFKHTCIVWVLGITIGVIIQNAAYLIGDITDHQKTLRMLAIILPIYSGILWVANATLSIVAGDDISKAAGIPVLFATMNMGTYAMILFANSAPYYGEFFLLSPGILFLFFVMSATLLSAFHLCWALSEKVFCRRGHTLVMHRIKTI